MARQAVYDNWIKFNQNKEGYLPFMYVDRKNLVTTGMGNLIDPINVALALPWKRADGTPASQADITTAWNAVKQSGKANAGGGSQGGLTTLRLQDKDVRSLIQSKLQQMESVIRERFPSYDSWPADAQLGILSMAWAMGPAFKYPKFQAAANLLIPDFVTMATESLIPELGSGDGGRNADNLTLFSNAAAVLASGADPNKLYWPGSVVVDTTKRAIFGGLMGVGIAGAGLIAWDWLNSK